MGESGRSEESADGGAGAGASSKGSKDKKADGTRLGRVWRHWVRPLLIIVIVVGSLRSAIADWNDVPTGSMKPTILEGDRIFINKVAYDLRVPFTRWRIAEWSDPVAGEIIVLVSPRDEKKLVKRVVAAPGDRIRLRNGRVYINGAELDYEAIDPVGFEGLAPEERDPFMYLEEVLGERTHAIRLRRNRVRKPFRELTVPEGSFFVMGDNRDESLDSRIFGFVDRERILGRAVAVALSVDPENYYMPRWKRFFTSLK